MRIPTIRGTIDRRVLVNFRVDPEVLARTCPPPFRPQIVNGYGIAGICLIRLKEIRPNRLPSFLGVSSENAAHRIAVQWTANGVTHKGVYIPRRDTSSRLNSIVGGRLFPGVHHHARFRVRETQSDYRIEMQSVDHSASVMVSGQVTDEWPSDSVFESTAECSRFFEEGSVGYSPTTKAGHYDGLELRTIHWQVEPLAVDQVHSSFFNDSSTFPEGSVSLDNALLMRGIDHQWHSREPICCLEG